MRRRTTIGLVVVALAGGGSADGQTVRPVLVEHRGQANGRFEVENPTLHPLDVTFEIQGFGLDGAGEMIPGELPPGLHVDLSASGFRLAPGQRRTVHYEADSDSLPAWFTIYAQFGGMRTAEGVALSVDLPHTVFVYAKGPGDGGVHVVDAWFDAGAREIRVDVRNAGGVLQRVREVRVRGEGADRRVEGFPILPGGRRMVRVPWAGPSPPHSVEVRGARFDTAQRPIRPAS